MEEFDIDVQCPHCAKDRTLVVAFNFAEAEPSGCDSRVVEEKCVVCKKMYYFTARVNFVTEWTEVWKKKPQDSK